MNQIKLISVGAFLLFSASCHAISIDSMLKFSDDNNEAVFTTKNTEDYRLYMNVAISELQTNKDGELQQIPYTRENIETWTLSATPSRTIVEPKFGKDFLFQYTGDRSVLKKDKMYQLAFVPTPYIREGQASNNVMQISVGIAPVLVVPAPSHQKPVVEITYNKENLVFKNMTGNYAFLNVKGCSSLKPECELPVHLLAGRTLTMATPKEFNKILSVKASDYESRYESYAKVRVNGKATTK
ncbi:hypothetical protein VP758_005204 [Vibrio harveyi]|nr:hypothetical protein [Vibrio harveyi]